MNVDKEIHWMKRKIPGTKYPRWVAVVIVVLLVAGYLLRDNMV